MKTKPDLKQHVQFDAHRSGCGIGCWSIGCMGVVGLVVMLFIAGYYSLFHSRLPLSIIEAAIEEDGEVEIEGLRGSLASGFSADEIRFKSVDDHWSSLTDIKFKYDGDISFFGSDRIIIEELSVAGGTIYADWDPDENELDFDPDIQGEIAEEMEEFDEEMQDEFGQSASLKELRIDLVSIANVKIINPATQLEITIDEVKFEGFEWREGELQSLGELLVKSSQLDLKTVPSIEFAQMKHAERFEGVLRAEADHRLKADVPFVFDFGVDDELDVSLQSELFGGRIRFSQLSDAATLSYLDFSPTDFIALKSGEALPSKINLELSFDDHGTKGPTLVHEGGSFDLGQTRFRDLRIDQSEDGPNHLMGTADVDGKVVVATIRIESPYAPLWKMSLESEAFETAEELWAQTVFGEQFEQLSDEQQAIVRASIPDQTATAEVDSGQDSDEKAVDIPAEAEIEPSSGVR